MMRRIVEASELEAAQELCRAIATNEAEFSPQWLASSNVLVIAQESGRHLEPDDAPLVANAFASAGAETLIAVTNDSLISEVEAYKLRPLTADLALLSSELMGINFVLTDASSQQCILFTTYDFKLIAGSRHFITTIVGDPLIAREEFADFYWDQLDFFRAKAVQAAAYMNWLDELPAE